MLREQRKFSEVGKYGLTCETINYNLYYTLDALRLGTDSMLLKSCQIHPMDVKTIVCFSHIRNSSTLYDMIGVDHFPMVKKKTKETEYENKKKRLTIRNNAKCF